MLQNLSSVCHCVSHLEEIAKVQDGWESAYRLRRKPGAGSFVAAWDRVVGRVVEAKRKVTLEERGARALGGLLKPLIYAGRYVRTVEKFDNSALLWMLARLDRSSHAGMGRGARGASFTPVPVSTNRAG